MTKIVEYQISKKVVDKIVRYDPKCADFFPRKDSRITDFKECLIRLSNNCFLAKKGSAYFLQSYNESDLASYKDSIPFLGSNCEIKNLISRLKSPKYLNQEFSYCLDFKSLPKEDLVKLCTAMASRIDRLQAHLLKVQTVVNGSITPKG